MSIEPPSRQTVAYVEADDGCRLWTTAGPPVAGRAGRVGRAEADGIILCHGGPGFWDTLGPIAELLGERARVVRWDQRGGGRSDRQGPYTVRRFLADLDAVRAHYGFDRVVVIGHSWGASLALLYALAHPERVNRLVYISGVGLAWYSSGERTARLRQEWRANLRAALAPYRERIAQLDGLAEPTIAEQRERFVLTCTADFPDPATALDHARDLATPYLGADPAVNPTLNAEAAGWPEADLVARCAALDRPTLIIDGGLDPRPRWGVDSLAEALPDCTRITLHGAGHLPWVDDPAGFRAALSDGLR